VDIVWSDTAVTTYLHIVDYIFGKWTIKEVEKFQSSVDHLLSQLTINKELCPASKLLSFRKCVLSKQTSLIYTSVGETLYLITFIDNRALHDY
jgi:hypothetical protein